MCRLLCIATKGIIPHTAMSGFKRLARKGKNPPWSKSGPRSGWGIGYYPGGKLRLVHEFGDATTSVRYDEVSHMASSNPDARVLLGQMLCTPSRELLERRDKLAPFSGADTVGKQWLFAFDGRVGENRNTGEPFAPDPVKEMAFERIFREILAGLRGGSSGQEEVRATIGRVLKATAADYRYDHLNLALTDGNTVYLARYVDAETDWNELNYCRTARAIIGCSEPLPTIEQKWEKLGNRQLLHFDRELDFQRTDL